MKFIPISKVFVRSLLYAFVLVASLNHSLSYGNYINDDILKSVKSSATESSSNFSQPESLDGIVHHNAGYGRDQNGNYFFAMSFGNLDWGLLNAEVTTYRDGTPIPQHTGTPETWANLTTGAWVWAQDGQGPQRKLYNWYAVMGIHDAASLTETSLRKEFAPEGWRVPTQADWDNFLNHLTTTAGYQSTEVAKAIAYQPDTPQNNCYITGTHAAWTDASTSPGSPGDYSTPNNATCFGAIPYGFYIGDAVGHYQQNQRAGFWMSDSELGNNGKIATVQYTTTTLNFLSIGKNYGFSVRFTRDELNDQTAPTIDSGSDSISVPENQTVVETYTASEDVIWAISDTEPDSDKFVISNDGVLSFVSAPDFEAPDDNNNDHTYDISIFAEDTAGNESTLFPLTVTVTNVDEIDPTITDGLSSVTIDENQTAVDGYAADEEVTWTLSGPDNALFEITPSGPAMTANLSFITAPDFENKLDTDTNNIYELDVVATDAAGNAVAIAVSVTVQDVDEVQPFITGPGSWDVDENTTFVYTYVSNKDVASWTLSGDDNALFDITSTSSTNADLEFKTAPDFENPVNANNQYSLSINLTDNSGFTAQKAVTVNVLDVNDTGPVISGSDTVSVPENEVVVSTYTANQTVSWSVSGNDSNYFTITTTGVLYFKELQDFETPVNNNQYSLNVVATDTSDNTISSEFPVTVTLTDIDEISPVISGLTTIDYQENVSANFTYTANEAVTWSLSGNDSGLFSISNIGALSFNSAPDYESPGDSGTDNIYNVTVNATDSSGNTSDFSVTITVADVDDSNPVITGNTTVSVQENQTVVSTYSSNEAVTWSLSGTDSSLFSISNTGELSFNSSPDFESPEDNGADNQYNVIVTATDSSDNSDDISISITLINIDEVGPTITNSASTSTPSINENQTYVATFSSNEQVTWSLSGADSGLFSISTSETGSTFSINSNSAQLSFISAPNYEAPADSNSDNVYELIVIATDSSTNTTEYPMSIAVTDQAEAFNTNTPPTITLNGPNPQIVTLGNSYIELGAVSDDTEDGPLTDQIVITGVSLINTNVVGTYTVQYSVTDSDGNIVSVNRTVEIIDTTPPQINLNGNSIISIEVGTTYNELGATATDNYDDDTTITSNISISGSVNTATLGSYTVSYDVTDASGNSAPTLIRTINVVDTTIPVLTLLGTSPVSIELNGTYSDAGAAASDNYDDDVSITTLISLSGTVENTIVGSYTLTYSVSDSSNNQAIPITRIVNVEDNTKPVITLLGNTNVTIEVGTNFTDPGVVASDNYDNDSSLTGLISVSGSVDTTELGTYLLTYSVSDSSGNSADPVDRTVQVVDTTAPIISLNGNSSINHTYQTSFVDPGATASDNYDTNLSSLIVVSGSVNENTLGAYNLLYDLNDSSGNSAATVTREVTVLDDLPPVITLTGDSVVYLAIGDSYVDDGATANDNYDGVLTGAIVTSGTVTTSTVGTYTISYNVSDSNGNQAAQVTRTVLVGTPPSITLQGDNPTEIEIGSNYIELGAIASDPEDGDLTNSISISGVVNTNVLGTYQIQYSVTDSEGNTTFLNRTVQVVDSTKPTILLIGDSTISVEVGSSFIDPGATASDTNDGDITSSIIVSGAFDLNSTGTYALTYNVSDSAGNSADSVTRSIIVGDTTPPQFSLNGNSNLNIDLNSVFVDPGAIAIDSYEGDISSSVNIIGNVDTSTIGSTTLFYNVSDSAGNAANQLVRIVNVVENTLPIISLIGDASVSIEVFSSYIDQGATASDNYDGNITNAIVSTGTVDTSSIGVTTIRYNVTDSSGNSAVEVTRTVTVEDTTAPILSLIGDSNMSLELGGSFNDPGATAADNFDGDITNNIVVSGTVDVNIAGSYTIAYNVSDSQGNFATQIIRTVVVGTPPSINLQGDNPQTIQYGEAYTELGATSSDVEDGDLTSSISITGSVNSSTLGTYNIQYSVTDSSGNTTIVQRLVNVVDTTLPEITLIGNSNEDIDVGSVYIDPGASATDNYDGDITDLIVVLGSVDPTTIGTYYLQYNVTDSEGNDAITMTRTINVGDQIPPTISLFGSQSITIEVGSSYSDSGASAIDNYDGNISSLIQVSGSVDPSVVSLYTIDYDITDSSGNSATTVTRTVNVVDTTKPVINLSGNSSTTIESGLIYIDSGATVSDNYDSGLTYNVDLSVVDTSTLGTYTLTYSATDSSGNQADPIYRTVEVIDTTLPVINIIGSSVMNVEASQSQFDEPGFTASDSYEGNITPSVVTSGVVDMQTLGTYILRYNVSDSSGNAAVEKTRTVTVDDNTSPLITIQGNETMNVELGSTFTDPGVSAFDNLDGDLTNSIIIEGSVDTFVAGVYTITYKVVDSQGNVAQQVTRTVIVGSPPVITLDGDNPMTLEVGTAYVEPGATALDDDEGDLTNQIQISGAVDENQLGQSNIVYTVEDINGNITSATRVVNVVDTTPPVLVLDDTSIITIEVNSPEYVNQTTFTYSDNYDQNLTDSDVIVTDNINENVVGDYTISFNLSDGSGNAAITQIRQVQVVDTQSPTITLIGDTNVSIEKGSSYIDAGATAEDNYDGDISSLIVTTNGVNTATIGSYNVNYNVSDSSGNAAPVVSRTVNVGPDVNAGSDITVCVEATINIGSNSNDLSYDYQWTASPDPTAANGPTLNNPTTPVTQVTVFTTTQFTLSAYESGVLVGSDVIVVTVIDKPLAAVAADVTICEGDNVQIGSASVPGHTYQWTSSPAGFSSSIANPTVSPSVTTTYTLVETINATPGCTATSSITISVEEPINLNVGIDTTICESEVATGYRFDDATSSSSNATYLWQALGGDGTFDNDSDLNATYFPGTTDISNGSVVLQLTATSTTGVCTSPVTDELTLSITPSASVDAGVSALVLCENESIQISGATAQYYDPNSISWTSSGTTGTMTGNNTLSPIYSPSASDVAAGSVTLTLSVLPLSPCDVSGPITDSVTINLVTAPSVSVPTGLSICEGENVPLTGATVSNASSFTWTDSSGGSFSVTGPNPADWVYEPNQTAIDNGGTVLTLTATPTSPCADDPSYSVTLPVVINKNPVVDAGPSNQILCEGLNPISGATADFADTLTWSTSGDGFFTTANSISPFYTPGPNDLTVGAVTLTLTATPQGACTNPVLDTVNFSVSKQAVVSAGGDAEVCEGDSYIFGSAAITDTSGGALSPTSTLWTTSGSGTFDNATMVNPVYTPSTADISAGQVVLTLTVEQNGCPDESDEMILTIVPQVSANAGLDLSICQDDSGIIAGASVTPNTTFIWTVISGAGTLQNETDINPVYQPSAGETGEIVLRLTVDPLQIGGVDCGNPSTDDVSIFIEPLPIVSAGSDIVICEDETYTFDNTVSATDFNSLTWSTQGDGSFDDNNALKPTYFPGPNDKANGGVILQLEASSNAPCTSTASDVMFLEITRKPVINAPSTINYCVDSSPIALDMVTANYYDTIQWTSSSGNASGTFSDNTVLNPDYTPSQHDINSGEILLTISATETSCPFDTEAVIRVVFVDLPTVDAGETPVEICEDSSYQLNGTVTGTSSQTWNTSGTGTFSNQTSEDPVYTPSAADIAAGVPIRLTLTAVSTSVCEAEISDFIDLTFAPSPIMNIGPDRTLCVGEDLVINLTAGSDVAHVDTSTYAWASTGNGFFNSVNTLSPTYSPSEDDISNGSVTISLTADALSPCGGTIQDDFVFTIMAEPTVNAGPDISMCETGGNLEIVAGDVTNYSSFIWTNESGTTGSQIVNNTSLTPTFIPGPADIANGFATLRLTAYPITPCATPATDDVIITIAPQPVVSVGGDNTICEGEEFIFLANIASVSNESSFSWSSNGGGVFANANTLTPTFTPSAAEITAGQAIISLTAQPISPCADPVVDTMTLIIQQLPLVEAGNNAVLCESDASYQTLTASISSESAINWTTSGSGTFDSQTVINTVYTPSINDRSLGFVTLTLTATPIAPCEPGNIVSDTITLTFIDSSSVSILRGDINSDGVEEYATEFCASSDYSFTDDQIIDSQADTYSWTTSGDGTFSAADEKAPTYTPGDFDKSSGTVTLTLTVADAAGCTTDSDSITISVIAEPTLDLSTSASSVCFGSDVQLTAIAQNYSSINWQITSGTGQIISGGNTLTPIYQPSSDSDTVVLEATVIGQNPCTESVTESITIQVTPNPDITNFPTDYEICFDENIPISGVTTTGVESSVEWTSDGDGTFDNTSSLNPSYFPSLTDIANGSVTLTMRAIADSPCSSAVDDNASFVVTLTPAPIITMSISDTVCEDSNYFVSDVSVENVVSYAWTAVGDGTFQDTNTLTPTYLPGTNDLAAGTFTLTLTAQGNGICPEVVATKEVTIIPTPIIELGVDTADYCTSPDPNSFDNPITIAAQTIQNVSAIEWRTSSDPTDPTAQINLNSDNSATYYPSQQDYDNGQVTITLVGFPIDPCADLVEDSLILSFAEPPVVDAGPDQTVCEDIADVQLNGTASQYDTITWTTSGNGTFTGNNNNIEDPIYIPSIQDLEAGSVTLTATAIGDINCTDAVDDVVITFARNPQVNVGVDLSLCEGDVVNFNDVTVVVGTYSSLSWVTTNGLGTLSGEQTLTPSYTPAPGETGQIDFVLTVQPQAPCTTAEIVTKSVIYVSQATADAGPDLEACQADGDITIAGASVANSEGPSWSVITGSGLLVNQNDISPTYTPSNQDWVNGQVILRLTANANPGCSDVSDDLVISLTPSPIVDAGIDVSVCNNSLYTTTTASVQYADNFAWSTPDGTGTLTSSANDTVAIYTPGADESGIVTLVLTAQSNGSCTEVVTDEILLTINPAPTADAGVDQTLCTSNNEIVLSGAVTNEASFVWTANLADGSAGSGTFTPNNDVSTTYNPSPTDIASGSVILSLTAVGLDGCIDVTDSMVVSFEPQPIVDAGTDASICEGESYDLTNSSPSYSYGVSPEWTIIGGDGNFSGNINSNILEPVYTPGPQDIIDGAVTLRLTLDPIDPCTESISDDVVIQISSAPTVSVINSFDICEGPFTVTGTTVENAGLVEWSIVDGQGSLAFENQIEPIYTTNPADVGALGPVILKVEVFGINGCDTTSASEFVTLNISPAGELDAGPDMTICEDSTTYTFSNGASSSNVQNIQWTHNGLGSITNGQGSLIPTYTPASGETGTITFTVTADEITPCVNSLTDTVSLTIIEKPTAEAGESYTTCAGPINLNGVVGGDVDSIQWSGGNGLFDDPTIGANVSSNLITTYYPSVEEIGQGFVSLILTANPVAPCSPAYSDLVTIYFEDAPQVNAGPVNASICEGDTYQLDQAIASNFTSFTWTTSGSGTFSPTEQTLQPVYIPSETDVVNGVVTLRLTASGNSDCADSFDELELIIDKQPSVVISETTLEHCETQPLILSNVTALHYDPNTVQWVSSSGADGYFTDDTALNPEYIPGPNDLANGVTLTVSLSGEEFRACSDQLATDSIDVIFSPAPIVDAGLDLEICEGISEISLSTASTSQTTSLMWTTTGTGTFDDASSLNAQYIPSTLDFSLGTVTLTLTGYNEGVCSQNSDTMTLTLTQDVVIITSQDYFTFCDSETVIPITGISLLNVDTTAGSPNVEWSIITGQGTWQNSNTEVNPTYIPGGNDYSTGVTLLLTAFGEGDCNFIDTQEINIEFEPEIIVNAGTGGTICEGQDFQVFGAQVFGTTEYSWTTSGDGFFNNANLVNPIYTPGPLDEENGYITPVTLTLTATGNGSCPGKSESIQLLVEPSISVFAGDDVTICTDQVFYTISDASTNKTNPVVTWTTLSGSQAGFVDPTTVNTSYQPLQEDYERGYVTLILRGAGSGNCTNSIQDTMTIFFSEAIDAFAGEVDSVCYPENYIVQDAVINSSQDSYSSYSWTIIDGAGQLLNPNSLTPEYVPSVLDKTNPNGVRLGLNIIPSNTGNFSCTPPPPFIKVIYISEDLVGTGSISGNTIACEGTSSTYSVTGLTGAVDYQWNIPTGATIVSGDGTSTILVSFDEFSQDENSEITVLASNNCPGQIQFMTLPIEIQADPELILTSANESNQVLCFNDNLNPIEYIFAGGTDDSQISIAWSVGGVNVSAPQGITTTVTANSFTISGVANENLTSDTVYSYELTASVSGCTTLTVVESGSITLSASPSLVIQDPATNNQTFCEGIPIADIEYTLENGADNVQFQWTSQYVPNGLTQTLSSGIYSITGLPDAQAATSVYTYQIIPVNSVTGCVGAPTTGSITVNALSSLVSINPGSESQSVCEGNPITPIEYSVGNAVSGINLTWTRDGTSITGNPPGIGYNLNAGQLVIGGNVTENITATTTYSYNIQTSGGLCGSGNVNGTIVVNPGPRIELAASTVGSLTQIRCEGDNIDDIVVNLLDGASSPGVTGLPAGVSYFYDSVANTLTISGTLDASNPNDNYNYTITASGSSGGCSASISGVLTISREDVLTPMSEISQSVCEGEAIDLIRYDYSGGAVGVTLSWIINGVPSATTPSGLVVSNADGILTISGTPSTNITTSSELGYTVTTTNSGCTPAKEYTGTISISPQPILLINSGTNTQTICEGVAMTDIVIDAAQGANNAIISWDVQPPGILGQFDATTAQFTISGTPSGINEDTTYNYSVKAINSIDSCESDTFTGSITVLNGHTLQLLSGSSSVNQTFCEGEELPFPVSYEFGGGALAARVLGLPPGLNWSITDNRITISGTPTVNVSATSTNSYTYTVETIGASCTSVTETGVIDLVPNPLIQLIGGLNTQSVCEDEAIVDIVYNTIDGAENVDLTWDSQPNGIYGQFDSTTNQFTISGTPTGLVEDKVYNYTIQAVNLSNNCVSSELTGSISVQNGHDLKLLSGSTSTNQSLCEGLELSQDIVYEFSGGANSARVLGLPPGIGWTVTGNVITISGSASENVTSQTDYIFTVETLGNNCLSASLTGQITINPDAEITLSTPSSTANQFICEGESIDPITYTFGGGTVDAVPSGLPPGITGIYNSSTRIMTITGTPTQNVEIDTSYNFTVRALNDQGCESPELTGEITVKANAELTLLSSTNTIDQTVCVNSNISDIRIRFKNSSVPSANNLPSGLSSEVVGTDVLRIFGSVSVGGPYTFDVIGTNTNGCSSTAVTVQLTVVPDYSINPTKVVLDMNDPANGTDESLVKNISCYGNRDGEIMVNLSNSSSSLSYIYSWSGPSNYANTTQSNHIKNLRPGNYTVSVFPQGNSSCPVTQSFTILQPQPTQIETNTISPVSCTGSDDGLISVSITGGNSSYYKNYIWEVLKEEENCVTYTIRLRDADNDGIFDIADADLDNDGVTDPNVTDSNNNGIKDEAESGSFTYSVIRYQSCDGTFVTDNKQSLNEFSLNGTYQICAIPNTVSPDTSFAGFDHDFDASTADISSIVYTGGTSSCSSGTWQEISRLKGTTYADNLLPGLYRLTVVEGPDLNDIESLDIDDLRNDLEVCITDEIFELPKDQILYGSVSVDDSYCSLSGGYIDIDVNQSAGQIFFKYDGVIVPSSDVSIIASEFGVNTYRVLISAPISDASFEIENANGCGIVVAQDLLDTTVLTPVINFTSPELEKYGTISERSNVLFTLANNTSYFNVEWDFGDASPIVAGERVSHQYFADGTYTVTVYVYNASGCFTTATQEIIVGKGYTILMPNAFSPNGDNINEIIGPVFTGLKSVDFFVYNKLGILVYQESVSETNLSAAGTIEINGWDGTNSDPASNFYVYKIIGVRINDEVVTKTGTIFLIE